jgi:hypothetical protein
MGQTHTPPPATADDVDIVTANDIVTSVYLPACCALRSDHWSALIDTRRRRSFLNCHGHPNFRLIGPNSRHAWKIRFRSIRSYLMGLWRRVSRPVLRHSKVPGSGWSHESLACWPAASNPIQDEIRLKDQLRTQWQITRHPGLKAKVKKVRDPTAVRVERRWW